METIKAPKELRIVFMGTPEFATQSLRELCEKKYNVVGVVTVPDKKAGRGQKLKQSDVKKFAEERDIPVLQPDKLKSPDFLEALNELEPDLQIVVAFRMLPEVVWALPKYGTFNLHASLLPDYRGAAPINHAIINGEKETGVTTFFIDQKIDTGNILFQQKVEVLENETAGELHDKLMHVGAGLIEKTIIAIANKKAEEIPQSKLLKVSTKINSAPKIFKEDCRINWLQSIDQIHNHIRGLSPYPGAYTELISPEKEHFLVKVYKSERRRGKQQVAPFEILVNQGIELIVCLPGGCIALQEIQLSGKRRMLISDFLRGFPIEEGWTVKVD